MGLHVLITGGTGSLGHALVEQLLQSPATERVIVFSRGEHRQADMAEAFRDPRLEFHLGDVRMKDRVRRSLRAKLDVVIHAAAMKRIEACQDDPTEALLTNVIGTLNVCEAAVAADIPKVIVISSDKCAESVTTYGATKALAERLAIGQQRLRGASRTLISAVRYGNCYDSAGAVLHVFAGCRANDRPMPITHEAMTRFWWSRADAAAFIIRVAEQMRGEEIWVPRLPGGTVVDLAQAVWPGGPTTPIGLRAYEKLHEVMVSEHEAPYCYELGPDAFVILQPGAHPPHGAQPVSEGFRYSSDQAPPFEMWRAVSTKGAA